MLVNAEMPKTPVTDRVRRHGFYAPESDLGLDQSPTNFEIGEASLRSIVGFEDMTSNTHKAIYRKDKHEIVGIVSQSYKPLHNREFFSSVEEALRRSVPEEMFEGVMVRDKIAHGGSWTQREYILPAYAEALKNTRFETQMGLRIVAWNSYDGSASAGLMTGLIDFWCTNGLIVGRAIDRELRRHTTRLTPEAFIPGLKNNIGKIGDEIENVRRLAGKKLDPDHLVSFLENNFSGARAAEMLRRVQAEVELRGETVQAVHAAMSYYTSHSDASFAVRNDDPSREARMLRAREEEIYKVMSSKEWLALAA